MPDVSGFDGNPRLSVAAAGAKPISRAGAGWTRKGRVAAGCGAAAVAGLVLISLVFFGNRSDPVNDLRDEAARVERNAASPPLDGPAKVSERVAAPLAPSPADAPESEPPAREVASAQGPAPAAQRWSVAFDPAPTAADIEIADDRRIEMPAGGEIITHAWPAPLIMVGRRQGEPAVREVWDVNRWTRVAVARGPVDFGKRRVTLSPDGLRFATAIVNGIPEATVYSTSASKPLAHIATEASQPLSLLAFLDPHRLLIGGVSQRRDKHRLEIWRLEPVERIHVIETPHFDSVNGAFAFSGGRRYLAILEHFHRVHVVDLQEGTLAGEAALPPEALPSHHRPESPAVSQCRGLAFSADGRRLAVMTRIRAGLDWLGEIDIATGEWTRPFTLEDVRTQPAYGKAPALQYLAGDAALLLHGSRVLACGTGDTVWNLPQGRGVGAYEQNFALAYGRTVLRPVMHPERRFVLVQPLPIQQIAGLTSGSAPASSQKQILGFPYEWPSAPAWSIFPPEPLPPDLHWRTTQRTQIDFHGEVLADAWPTPLVLFGETAGDSATREVWDLRAQKRRALSRGALRLEPPFALSPEGKFLAGVVEQGKRITLEVRTIDGRAAKRASMPFGLGPASDGARVPLLAFRDDRQLWGMIDFTSGPQPGRLLYWRFVPPENYPPQGASVPPEAVDVFTVRADRKYLAFVGLSSPARENGVERRQLSIQLVPKSSERHPTVVEPDLKVGAFVLQTRSEIDIAHVNYVSAVYGMAFSPYEDEFALYVELHSEVESPARQDLLLVLGPGGRIAEQHQVSLPDEAWVEGSPRLQWIPDRRGWLLNGRWFFDRAAARAAATPMFPMSELPSYVRMFDGVLVYALGERLYCDPWETRLAASE